MASDYLAPRSLAFSSEVVSPCFSPAGNRGYAVWQRTVRAIILVLITEEDPASPSSIALAPSD